MIDVHGVTKAYGDVHAVEDVTVSIGRGRVTGLLGPNGAGKTTLLKMALGLIEPTRGTVTVDGVDVGSHPRQVYRRVTAVLEGARNVYWRLTPLENMAFFAALQGVDPRSRRTRHREILAALDLAAKADVPVNDLSRGMKQKVSIACGLARETQTIVLDEPTLGLDVAAARRLRGTLRELARARDMTIVLSSHDMALVADVCDRVVVLRDGRLVADCSPESLLEVLDADRYRIVVRGEVSSRDRGALERTHDLENWRVATDRTTVSYTTESGGSLYPLVNCLRERGIELVEISPAGVEFEDAFLRLTESDPDGETEATIA